MTLGMSDLPTIYNVTNAVGLGQINRRTDVLLVQLLLKMAKAMILSGGLPTSSTEHIKVDGYFGPETKLCINAYQQEQAQFYHKLISKDGLVHPSSADGYTSGGWLYTIVHLNRSAKTKDAGAYRNLPYSENTPPELRTALLKGQVEVFNP